MLSFFVFKNGNGTIFDFFKSCTPFEISSCNKYLNTCFLGNGKFKENRKRGVQAVQSVDQVLEKPFHRTHQLGIGTTFYNLNYGTRSNRQKGLNMLQNMFAFKGDMSRDTHMTYEYAFLFELEEGLCSTIMRSTTKKIQGKLDDLAISLASIQPDDSIAALRVYLHLMHAIIRTVYKAGFTLGEIIGSDIDPCAHMEQFDSKHDIHQYMEGICLHICKYMAALRLDKNQRIVWEVKAFIDANFTKDFGLEELSELVKCSSTYINRLLKQHTGSTFYNLLTDKRIVRSKELLFLNDWTVNQISNEVGYNNVHSFIRAFKRSEGITPGQFRDLVVDNRIEF